LSGVDDHNAWTAPFNRTTGNTIEDTVEVSRWLADAGVDVIHLSQGDTFPHPRVPAGLLPTDEAKRTYAVMYHEGTRTASSFLMMQFRLLRRILEWNWGRRMPFIRGRRVIPEKVEGMNQGDAAKIKHASGLPVICVGGWQTAAPIREALRAERCDVISIARGLLANPDLVELFARGQDAPAKPCTYCNKCAGSALLDPLACYDETRFHSRDEMYEQAYRIYKEAAVGVHNAADGAAGSSSMAASGR